MTAWLSHDMPGLLADVPALLRVTGLCAALWASGARSRAWSWSRRSPRVMHGSGVDARTATAGDLQTATGGGSATSVHPSTGADVMAFVLMHDIA